MNELKFRAWVNETINYDGKLIKKGMHTVTGVHFFEGQELTSVSIDAMGVGEIQDIWLEGKPIKLMKFTGLKDCDGVDIYEGDIIKIPYTYYDRIDFAIKVPYDEHIIGVVEFNEKSGAFGVIIPEDCDELNKGFNSFDFAFENIGYECVVVDNKFENPELMNGILECFEDD
jgi:uncharacterized phage protein (TIGR01671 family)